MSGRGQAVTPTADVSPADIEVVRFVIPWPPNGAVTTVTPYFYVPIDIPSLNKAILTLTQTSSHTLTYIIRYSRSGGAFNSLSGNLVINSGVSTVELSPTWAGGLLAGDRLRLDSVSGDGTDSAGLTILVTRNSP